MFEYDTYKTKTCPLKFRKIRELPELKATSPEVVAKYMCMNFRLEEKTEEFLYLVTLSTQGNSNGIFFISRGTINMTCATPSEIFKRALLVNASNIIMIHNHPSGNVNPSSEDIHTSVEIKNFARNFGINFLDSIIVSNENDYLSLKEKNFL